VCAAMRLIPPLPVLLLRIGNTAGLLFWQLRIAEVHRPADSSQVVPHPLPC
jgi:hypothetical protein